MTDEEAVEAFEAQRIIPAWKDREEDHVRGDEFVGKVLRMHGFPKLAEAYCQASEKWWYS